ncbi:hypothetical protein C2E20_4498 [Micractinium conductrix]|uniref:Uncharacterized protein n=1 Tax=Micractinium conductrix TaxID=554055 RepID=A0A2P6VDV2_9CHLO|nr:hypothetical protein C2E20_4498 [Micractinium conductrix]|eukprot:PSC72275.1 hypothetical protein C2E20_4498 [Micractinium conductrix]
MQGLRPYVQDENALAGLHCPAAQLKGGLNGGGLGGLPAGKATPGLAPRKALGNITNRGGLDAENAPPGKTPAGGAAPTVRRALGDITNSNAAPAHRPSALKPQQAPVQQQQQQAAAACAAAPASRVDVLAEGAVERQAGRGWEALERERLAREDAESTARLAALANFPARPLPNFFPLWGQQLLRKDVLPVLPASPLAERYCSFAAAGDLSAPDLSLDDLCLPDVPFPDIDIVLAAAGLDEL